MKVYVGVDIGGTNIKIAAVTPDGLVLTRGVIETRPAEGAERALRRVHDAARFLAGGGRVVAVGVGCAGLVDGVTGKLRASPNLKRWEGTPLKKIAGRRFGVSTLVENDATSAAFGESLARGERGRDLVLITLGTGVGGGVVADGRVVRGTSGFGGEIGHMTIDPDGPRCHCGDRGCLEAYAGAYAVVRTARALLKRRRRGWLARRLERGEPLSARLVFNAARRGDPAGKEAVRVAGEHLGIAVASILDLLNPSVVVIGGGVAASFEVLEPHIRRAVRRHAFPAVAAAARIEGARLGNDAALVGAAMLARDLVEVGPPRVALSRGSPAAQPAGVDHRQDPRRRQRKGRSSPPRRIGR